MMVMMVVIFLAAQILLWVWSEQMSY